MIRIILLLTILTVINGSCIFSDEDNSCPIFELDKFVGSTELDIEQSDSSETSIIRIFKYTSLIFQTTEGFTRASLPSKFTIEFIYTIKFQPTCTWTVISITDCKLKELFSVSMDPEKKLLTVSFNDRYGDCTKSIFIDYDMSQTCRRKLIIEVDSHKVSVLVDNKPLRYYSGDLNGNLYTRELINLRDTETKLFRYEDDRYSVELDVERFVVHSDYSTPRYVPERQYHQIKKAGSKGEPGRKGVRGDKGPKGDRGDCGSAGSNGIDGEIGERNDCKFPIQLAIKGPKGKKGEKGCKGDDGAAGGSGVNGKRGTNGDDGLDGSDGSSGSIGQKGEKGSTGSTGEKGSAGNPGIKGDKGLPLTTDQVKQIVYDIVYGDYDYDYAAFTTA